MENLLKIDNTIQECVANLENDEQIKESKRKIKEYEEQLKTIQQNIIAEKNLIQEKTYKHKTIIADEEKKLGNAICDIVKDKQNAVLKHWPFKSSIANTIGNLPILWVYIHEENGIEEYYDDDEFFKRPIGFYNSEEDAANTFKISKHFSKLPFDMGPSLFSDKPNIVTSIPYIYKLNSSPYDRPIKNNRLIHYMYIFNWRSLSDNSSGSSSDITTTTVLESPVLCPVNEPLQDNYVTDLSTNTMYNDKKYNTSQWKKYERELEEEIFCGSEIDSD